MHTWNKENRKKKKPEIFIKNSLKSTKYKIKVYTFSRFKVFSDILSSPTPICAGNKDTSRKVQEIMSLSPTFTELYSCLSVIIPTTLKIHSPPGTFIWINTVHPCGTNETTKYALSHNISIYKTAYV